jgi:hypothetical protein
MTSSLSGRSLSLACLTAAFGAMVLSGCAGIPVPTRAIAGTTVGFAVATDDPTFGGAMAYGSSIYPDPQRGVLGIRFAKSGTTLTVPAKMVTRVSADKATPVALTGSMSTPISGFPSSSALDQVLALVDIPHTLPAGTYTITVRRYKTSTDMSDSNLVDQGPIDSPLWTNSIVVFAGDGADHFTPFTAGVGAASGSLTASQVQQVTPLPELLLQLPANTAAATIDITYPDAKMDIVGAYYYRLGTHTTFVSTEVVDTNTVRIHAIDPLAQGYFLSLVFKNTQTGYNPIAVGEFFDDAAAFYDGDGDPIVPDPNHFLLWDVQ